jgi:Xaa-Pro aminopeptidase
MDTYKEFQNRRKILEVVLGDGIAIISNSDESSRNRDCDYPFRSDSYFHYLSGFPESKAVILIVGGSRPRSIIFCKPKDESKEIWDGYIHGPEEAAKQFLFDEAYSLDEINKITPKILKGYIPDKNIYCIPPVIPSNSGIKTIANIQNWMGKKSVENEYCDLSKILDGMRCLKSEGEINIMQKSANIAAQAHMHAMGITKPGKYEHQIEGEILNQFMQNGARYPAYSSIVAGGNNACTLHYVRNNSILKDGDLLLIDAGCELESYASDITRTYPINGKFTSPQKDIYQIVLNAQKEAIKKVMPGNYFDDPHKAAIEQIVNGLIDLKILKASRDEVFEKELYKEFFMHRTSHWLGLDVHDAGQYFDDSSEGMDSKPVKFQDSNILTVEPGCYIKPHSNVAKEFWGIGIRIEDDVLVTPSGNRVLSANASKEIEDLEDTIGSLNE